MEAKGNIEVNAFTKAFVGIAHDPKAVNRVIKRVLGKKADLPLASLTADISTAAQCVDVHFGLSPEKVGVPLITLHVVGIQMAQDLAGDEADDEDSADLAKYGKAQYDAVAESLGIPSEVREDVWKFTMGQALSVLRGDFADGEQEMDLGSDDDLEDLFRDLGLARIQ